MWGKSTASLSYRYILTCLSPPGIDLSAAAHADVLFAKRKPDGESDLAQYCEEEGIGYVPFRDFGEALPIVQAVVGGSLSVAEALKR